MASIDDALEARILLPGRQARLVGHAQARQRLLEAFAAGRAHHAWLITGPRGVGKATFAWHMARLLLAFPGAALAQAPQEGLAADHPVFQQMAAGAHPDFFLLRRTREKKTKKLRARIAVEDARALGHFLSLKSAGGGRRVVVVDSADEMNRETANAILKLLEEPPARTYLFLLSAAPGKLLPTIRSRCVRLPLAPLTDEQVREALLSSDAPQPDESDEDALAQAIRLSRGCPGVALDLSAGAVAELWNEARQALEGSGTQALARVAQRAGQTLGPAQARAELALFVDMLQEWLTERMRRLAMAGNAAQAARVAELLEEAQQRFSALEAVNLDRRQFVEWLLRKAYEVNRLSGATG